MSLKTKEYRLYRNIAPISYVLQTGAKGTLLTFDKKEETNRSIRHCRNEKSPYIDEQSPYAKVEPLIFESGYLRVKPTEVVTQKFLDIHPGNSKNGGHIFEEVDNDVTAKKALEIEDLIVDLKSQVREKQKETDGLVHLQTLAAVIKNSYVLVQDMSMAELRNIIYRSIDANPLAYKGTNGQVNIFNESVLRKYLALRSIGEGLIVTSVDGRSLLWGDTKELIASIPSGRKVTEWLAEYLETDDGMLVLDRIKDEI